MSPFHVGMQVVCVREVPYEAGFGDETRPMVGLVYTVRDVEVVGGYLGLRLQEIVNRPRDYMEKFAECTFQARRFRPVRKTVISIFQAMLSPKPKQKERV